MQPENNFNNISSSDNILNASDIQTLSMLHSSEVEISSNGTPGASTMQKPSSDNTSMEQTEYLHESADNNKELSSRSITKLDDPSRPMQIVEQLELPSSERKISSNCAPEASTMQRI